jgi:hypothetical protein
MREICTSGSVGGEGGDILAYPALRRSERDAVPTICLEVIVGGHVRLRYATAALDHPTASG